jgi:hypothetical protein
LRLPSPPSVCEVRPQPSTMGAVAFTTSRFDDVPFHREPSPRVWPCRGLESPHVREPRAPSERSQWSCSARYRVYRPPEVDRGPTYGRWHQGERRGYHQGTRVGIRSGQVVRR